MNSKAIARKPKNMIGKTKVCRNCRHDIPVQATYCQVCNSYQDWRRHFHAGKGATALIVAAGAAFGISGQQVVRFFWPERASMFVSGGDASDFTTITIYATNAGDVPAVVANELNCIKDDFHLSYKSTGPLIVPARSSGKIVFATNSTWAVKYQRVMQNFGPLPLQTATTFLDDENIPSQFVCEVNVFDDAGDLPASFRESTLHLFVPAERRPALISSYFAAPIPSDGNSTSPDDNL